MGAVLKLITSDDFEYFELVEDLGLIFATENSKSKKRYGMFKCSCEKVVKMPVASAKKSKMCKYCKAKLSPTKHGMTDTRIHVSWKNMKARCYNKNKAQYQDYGGRGITVCKEWKSDFMSFCIWATSNGYTDDLTLDRIDNNKGYSPKNCRWVTMEVQSRNRRVLCSTNTSGYKGITKTTESSSWTAQISIGNEKVHIGCYHTKKEAAKAYDEYIKTNKLEHSINGI